jgi:Flp pilus assembly pilin Flp
MRDMNQLAAYIQTRLYAREEGQTMAEYGVVLGVITVAAVGAFALLGTHIKDVLNLVIGRF